MQIHLKNYDCSMFSELKAERDYQHEAGMRLLTDALKTDFNLQIEREDIVREPSGKPYIGRYPDIRFNITHTDGLVGCVTGNHPVGIDAEPIRPFPKAILRKMTEGERAYIASAGNPDEAFMRVWTMKEAYIKLTGKGLAAFSEAECIPGQELDGIECRQMIWQGKYVVTAMEKNLL